MGRTERFNYTSDEEKQSLINKAKKGVAAVALATTGLFASACSGGEGEAKGPSVGGILSTGGSSEVLYGDSCANAESIVSVGTIGSDNNLQVVERFPDVETLKGRAAIPDGIAKLAPTAQGYLIDVNSLTSRQNDQLWNSYQKYADTLEEHNNKQESQVVVYGKVDQDLISEYQSGAGWPESLSDGVIDSPDLNLCVMNSSDYVNSDNWVQ